jgi:CheY-like chemotaxis protein
MDEETFQKLPVPIALVVDDEPLILMDTCDLITDAGFYVIEANTADEAFAFLNDHSSLQLVLTDIQMPGSMDGIQLAREIADRWPHIKIIVASGAVKPAEGVLPASATFMSKPISVDLVNRSISKLFSTTTRE